MNTQVGRAPTIGFVLLLALLLTTAMLGYRYTRTIFSNDALVAHTYKVQNELGNIVSILTDAETGQRGYLITGEEPYLQPYYAASEQIRAALQRLRELTANDPAYHATQRALRHSIDLKFQDIEQTIRVRRERGFAAAQKLVVTDFGKQRMDEIRSMVSQMREVEDQVLERRLEESRTSFQSAVLALALIVALGIILVASVFVTVERHAAERARLLEQERFARGEAEHASRLKDDFLATVSHELRTPLNAVVGWSRMLASGMLAEDRRAHALAVIERNAMAQAKLIEDLLDVSRLLNGGQRLEVRPIGDLTAVVLSAVEAIQPAADAKRIRLLPMLDAGAGPVLGDPSRLQQVAWNLVSNAVKFTPEQGSVEIRLARINSHVELRVDDSGEGIPPAFLPFVFDRFRQGDSSTTRKKGGLGLGLAIVREIVELHGGSVHADSQQGRGSTFVVNLPIMVGPDAAPDKPAPTPPPTIRGVRVLVVEDDADGCEFLRVTLEHGGADVRTARSVDQALQELARWLPDVLISDIAMPIEDGYALIRRLRASESQTGRARTPAVALSGYSRSDDREKVLSAGFQTHLAKPVSPEELIATVARLADRSRASQPPASA